MASNIGSIKRACASIYFRFSSLLVLDVWILWKNSFNVKYLETMTDTMMQSMEAEHETDPGLSISTMTFDLG